MKSSHSTALTALAGLNVEYVAGVDITLSFQSLPIYNIPRIL